MSKALNTLLNTIAEKLGMGDDGAGLMEALKTTAFKPAKQSNGSYVTPSEGQIMALLVVANQYGLNPWLKELYAFPDKFGGIVPVVGVDGWSRIINENPQFDGVDFDQDADMCTCTIYRKDRNHPTRITEYMIECKGNAGPWSTHPYRMLRHKALIQCARLAFGFGGLYDQDEANRIVEAIDGGTGEITQVTQAKPRRASEAAQTALPVPTDPVVLEPVIGAAQQQAQPVVEQAQAAQQQQAPATASAQVDTGEPASPGEMMNIIKTATAKRIDLVALLEEIGIALDPATLAGLTKTQFKSIKARL